ncbi:uncharacterized protein VP01_7124g1, partial [Puccinia sorghi]
LAIYNLNHNRHSGVTGLQFPSPPLAVLLPNLACGPSAESHQPPPAPTPIPPSELISSIIDESIRVEVHSILKNFQGNLNHQNFTSVHGYIQSFIECQARSMPKRTPPP